MVGKRGNVAERADRCVEVRHALVWGSSRVVGDVPSFLWVLLAVDEVRFDFSRRLQAVAGDCC